MDDKLPSVEIKIDADGKIEGLIYIDDMTGDLCIKKLTAVDAVLLEDDLGRALSSGKRWPLLRRRLRCLSAAFARFRSAARWRWDRIVALFAFLAHAKEGPRCIKCHRLIRAASLPYDERSENLIAWDMPNDATVCDGGWSFGSTLYDATLADEDGLATHIELVICDGCIPKAIRAGFVREVRTPRRLRPGTTAA